MNPIHRRTVEFPTETYRKLDILAAGNRRSANAEIVVAVERHVEAEEHRLNPDLPRRSKR